MSNFITFSLGDISQLRQTSPQQHLKKTKIHWPHENCVQVVIICRFPKQDCFNLGTDVLLSDATISSQRAYAQQRRKKCTAMKNQASYTSTAIQDVASSPCADTPRPNSIYSDPNYALLLLRLLQLLVCSLWFAHSFCDPARYFFFSDLLPN